MKWPPTFLFLSNNIIMKEFKVHHIKNNSTDIYLMQFDEFDPLEYVGLLTANETERLMSFKHVKRKREFVATRILRHDLFGFGHILYDENGAPYIDNEGYISISHGKNLVGIALNTKFKIGFDIELPRSTILELKNKFLSDEESISFKTENILEMTKVWSAKEVLYKLAGRRKILFKKELLLRKVDDSIWAGQIINPDHALLVDLDIFEAHNAILSINTREIVRVNTHI
jgi:4'-phosphopantetheinyl transferase